MRRRFYITLFALLSMIGGGMTIGALLQVDELGNVALLRALILGVITAYVFAGLLKEL